MFFNLKLVFFVLADQFITVYIQLPHLRLQFIDPFGVPFEPLQQVLLRFCQRGTFTQGLLGSCLVANIFFKLCDLFANVFDRRQDSHDLAMPLLLEIDSQLFIEFLKLLLTFREESFRIRLDFFEYSVVPGVGSWAASDVFHGFDRKEQIRSGIPLQYNSTMSQLSPLSQKVLGRIKALLIICERILASGNQVIFKTVPYILNNIRYALIALKDVASFVPSYLYKLIAVIIAISFFRKLLRRSHKKQQKESQTVELLIKDKGVNEGEIQKQLDKLGPEFQVKQGPTGPGETQEDQDSCCQDLTHHLSQPEDFRDIVFFELMRGYRRSAIQGPKDEGEMGN